MFIKICTGGGDPLLLSPLLKCTTHHLTVLTPTIQSPSTFSKCWWMSTLMKQWVPCFLHGGFSDTHLLHTHFHIRHHCVRLPLCCYLPQSVMGYWWEGLTFTAVSPTSASDNVGQAHKIWGIAFRTALVYMCTQNIFPFLFCPIKLSLYQSTNFIFFQFFPPSHWRGVLGWIAVWCWAVARLNHRTSLQGIAGMNIKSYTHNNFS